MLTFSSHFLKAMSAHPRLITISSRLIAAAAATVMLLFTSCNPEETSSNRISIQGGSEVEYNTTAAFLNIISETSWEIQISYEDPEMGGWCTPSLTEGTGRRRVALSLSENIIYDRTALISVRFGSETKTVMLTQLGPYEESTTLGDWFELPSGYNETGNNFRIVAHYVPDARSKRNFTIRYNIESHFPEWVAYPMHSDYFKTGGTRTDDWKFDPQIDEALQPNLYKSMGNGYDRGHMIPSAARNRARKMNEQTFFYTNMTCQDNDLNGGVWTRLEERVRTWAGSGGDTLYVVTGAVLRRADIGTEQIAYTYSRNDPARLSMAVPNYYYKALLRRTASDNYKGIAFWFDHVKTAAADRPLSEDDAISLQELERRTGLEFFPQMPANVANTIKPYCRPGEWL